MKAQILQLICTVYVDLTSGRPGVQFHYAFWDFFCFWNEASPGCAPLATNFWPTILANVGCTTFFRITVLDILRCQRSIVCSFGWLWNSWFQSYFKVRLFFYWINHPVSDCIVIAVLIGIEISHKLFTPEMVTDAQSIRGCESVLGMPLCRLIPVQLWTRWHHN